VAIVGSAVIGDVTVIGRVAVRTTTDRVRPGRAPGVVRRAVGASGVLLASAAAVVALGVLADVAVATHGPAGPPAAGAPH
jgi:hypothetical protein